DRLDCDAADCLVVGDRLDTDIALGAGAGMTTVLVRSGVTDDARLERSPVTPDYVVDDLSGIESVLDGTAPRYG
ncbi:HAD hydrolase-like protein, partial [Halolamina salina]